MEIAGDRPPRYGEKNATPPLTVGRGPVPRHPSRNSTIAGETRSDARMASEGPRTTKKITPLHRRARACPSPAFDLHADSVGQDRLILTRLRSGDRKLQRGEIHIGTMDNAGDRPPRYEKKRPPPHRRARACPSPSLALQKTSLVLFRSVGPECL